MEIDERIISTKEGSWVSYYLDIKTKDSILKFIFEMVWLYLELELKVLFDTSYNLIMRVYPIDMLE